MKPHAHAKSLQTLPGGAARKWALEDIPKYSMALSATAPIMLHRAFYSEREEPFYDMHYALELGIMVSGSMHRFYPDHRCIVGPGQTWLCGMWEPHGMQLLKTPCECAVLWIWPPFLAGLRFDETPNISWLSPFMLNARKRPGVATHQRRRMIRIGQQLLRAHGAADAPLYKLHLRFLLLDALLILYEQGGFQNVKHGVPSVDTVSRLNQALQLVFNSRTLITTTRAAKACGMSRAVFSDLFYRWMGIRFAAFGLRYRITKAASELAQNNAPLKVIAARWGFTDPSHFLHCFENDYHCTPGEYRIRRRNLPGAAAVAPARRDSAQEIEID